MLYNESLGQTISQALDMLDPQKRLGESARFVRRTNNTRIASMAIARLIDELTGLNIDRKLRVKPARTAPKAKLKPKPSLLQRKYALAMFVNQCQVASSKSDKGEEYWLNLVRAKAKELSMAHEIKKLPTQPYPTDPVEFAKRYGPQKA